MLRRSLSRLRPSSGWRLLHEHFSLAETSAAADLASTSGRSVWNVDASISSLSPFFQRRRSSLFAPTPVFSTSFSTSTNVDPREVSKFDYDWWDPAGPAAPLHALNSARVKFIRSCLEPAAAEKQRRQHKKAKTKNLPPPPLPLSGLRILDVGCGGGILSEPLARLGAQVTGIDASSNGPEAAARHAAADPAVAARLDYLPATSLEELLSLENGTQVHSYDCVIASEVIEHVPDPFAFLKELEKALEKEENDNNSAVVVSTLARTPRSWLAAVAGAEHLVKLLPVGTHDWNKFLNPEELSAMAEDAGLEMDAASGMEPEVGDPGEAVAAAAAATPSLVAAAAEAARRRLLGGGGGGGEEKKSVGPHPAVGALFGKMSWTLTGDLGVNYIASFKRKR